MVLNKWWFLLIALVIFFGVINKDKWFDPGMKVIVNQMGGGGDNVGGTSIEELRHDREKYFRFHKGTFPQLDKVTGVYQDKIEGIESKKRMMTNVIDDYQKTNRLLQTSQIPTPPYSVKDLKRKDREILTQQQLLNSCLNLYLELANLNNQLLVWRLYNRKDSDSKVQPEINDLEEAYRKKRRSFLKVSKKLGQ